MNTKTLKFLGIALVGSALLITLAPSAQAQSFLPACVTEGYCTLCHMLELAINFGKFLLGIVGSLALLMFVYGGFMWLTSGGEASRIDAGKKILVNSVIGVAITFFAWVVVAFVVSTLTAGNASFKWDVTLECVDLPGLEPISLEERDYGTGTGETQGTIKEGGICAASNLCANGLYCDITSKTCTKKIKISIETAMDKKCKGVEIDGKDDIACSTGRCCTIPSAIWLDCTIKLSGYCVYSENVKAGEECLTTPPCVKGTYCKISAPGDAKGSCQLQKSNNAACDQTTEINGEGDKICVSDSCVNKICVPPILSTNSVDENSYCQSHYQCKNYCLVFPNALYSTLGENCKDGKHLYCYTEDKKLDVGKCTRGVLPKGAPCEDTVIIPLSDNPDAPCAPGSKCQFWSIGAPGGTGICQ